MIIKIIYLVHVNELNSIQFNLVNQTQTKILMLSLKFIFSHLFIAEVLFLD